MRRTRGAAAVTRALALTCALAAAARGMASAASPTASTAPEDVALLAWIAERGGDLGGEIRRPAGGPRGVFAVRDHEGAAGSRRCASRECVRPQPQSTRCVRVKCADAVRAACGASLRNTEGDLIGYLPFTAALQVGRSDTWEGVSKITRAAADPASPYYVKVRAARACCCAAWLWRVR